MHSGAWGWFTTIPSSQHGKTMDTAILHCSPAKQMARKGESGAGLHVDPVLLPLFKRILYTSTANISKVHVMCIYKVLSLMVCICSTYLILPS